MPISLTEWQSFYVITGSSAAALTGLMFVVVALAADAKVVRKADGVGAFTTPTVGHFAIVLLLASIMTMPRHSVLSLAICLTGAGLVGIWSVVAAGMRMSRIDGYTAVAEDWAWHILLPFMAYAGLLGSAVMLGAASSMAMMLVAAVVLVLLFIGIHNAWDVAVYMVIQRGTESN